MPRIVRSLPCSAALCCVLLLLCEVVAVAQAPVTGICDLSAEGYLMSSSQTGLTRWSWPALKSMPALKSTESIAGREVAIGFPANDLLPSPSGKLLAVAGGEPAESGTALVLDWPSGVKRVRLTGHLDVITALHWLDDQRLVTVAMDQQVKVWDISAGQTLATFDGHAKGVTDVCGIGKTRLIATSGLDQGIRIWDLDSSALVRSLSLHTGAVNALVAKPSGQDLSSGQGLPMIASGSDDGTVRFWQPTIGRMVRFAKLPAPVLDLVWSTVNDTVIASCNDGYLYWIDPLTVTIKDRQKVSDGWPYALAIVNDGNWIVVEGRQGDLVRIPVGGHDEQ